MKTTKAKFVTWLFLGILSFCSLTPKIYGQDNKKQTDCQIKSLRQSDSITRTTQDKLGLRVDYIEKNINTRYDDFLKFLGVIVTLLVGLSVLSFFRSAHLARESAKEEFNKKFKESQRRIRKIEADAQQLLGKIQGHEQAARELKSSIEIMGGDGLNRVKNLIDSMETFLKK